MGKIEVKVVPEAHYKGKTITKIGNWYVVNGQKSKHKTLTAATDSI